MKLRLEFAQDVDVLREERIGRYRVQAFRYPYPGLDGSHPVVYRLLLEEWEGAWRKVRCWTRAEEKAFPCRPALAGMRIVNALKAWFGEN